MIMLAVCAMLFKFWAALREVERQEKDGRAVYREVLDFHARLALAGKKGMLKMAEKKIREVNETPDEQRTLPDLLKAHSSHCVLATDSLRCAEDLRVSLAGNLPNREKTAAATAKTAAAGRSEASWSKLAPMIVTLEKRLKNLADSQQRVKDMVQRLHYAYLERAKSVVENEIRTTEELRRQLTTELNELKKLEQLK
jgi:hypothetical protein